MTNTAASATAIDGTESRPAGFRSILYGTRDAPPGLDEIPEPSCFVDLNLDQVVTAIAGAKELYRLSGYFRSPLADIDTVRYRQDVFRDLERPDVYDAFGAFAAAMRTVRQALALAEKTYYHYQRRRWFLDGVLDYCAGVEALAGDLERLSPTSAGMRGAASFLAGYARSSAFSELSEAGRSLRSRLDALHYDLHIRSDKVTVGAYDGEPDYTSQVTRTFERFRQREPDKRTKQPRESGDMDHVEAQVLEQVANLFPGVFVPLDEFCERHDNFSDATVLTLDHEIQFYVAYLDYISVIRAAGYELSYPTLSVHDKQENMTDTFDLALASQLVRKREAVVRNDVELSGVERILVVSGPNNGGKTTLARTVGQLHYLAKLGCPVPGRDVELFFVDAVYTHFEKEEDLSTLAGKLQEELNRFHADFELATPRSLVIMNEMFSSTTVHDALFLSTKMLGRLSDLDALGVCVTFLDELSLLNDKTVSMVSTVVPDDPARRTHKVIRRAADGRAFARALADKYGLTYEALTRRVAR